LACHGCPLLKKPPCLYLPGARLVKCDPSICGR
jgi:hypothetical protein